MIDSQFANKHISNPHFLRMLKPHCLTDRINYLEHLTDFYFKAIVEIGYDTFKDEFRAEMSTTLQMMFTKAKMFLKLLEGFSHSDEKFSLNNLVDHTVLFTLVRTAYEQLCAFELVYVLPDTPEKKLILEKAYVATGLVNRHKLFAQDALDRNKTVLDQELAIIEDCKNIIHSTELFLSLNEKEQKNLDDEIFKKGSFQLYFSANGKLIPHVGWDQVRSYCNLGTDTLKGLYKYACNMAHPSYLGLIQFRCAFKGDAMSELIGTATMQLTSILSVFIMDYMNKYSKVKELYDKLDCESQFMICMYSQALRKDNNA